MVRHVFPLDAEYDFRVGRTGSGFGLTAVGGDEQIEITLDGERLRVLGRDAPRRAHQGARRARTASAWPWCARPTRAAWTTCSPSTP